MAFLQPKSAGDGFKGSGGGKKSTKPKSGEQDYNPSIDLSIRRRSSSSQSIEDEGVAFITPQVCDDRSVSKGQKKNFFRPNSRQQAVQPAPLTVISSLTYDQKVRVATLLNLTPPTPENLTFFLQQSNTKNPQIVHALTNILENVINSNGYVHNVMTSAPMIPEVQSLTTSPVQSPFGSPQNIYASTPNSQQNMPFSNSRKREQTPPISSFEFNDIRFTHFTDENVIMKKPLILGPQPVEMTFHIPGFDPDVHVIIQCYFAGVAPSPISWPPSLRVLVNGKQIKAPGICRFPALDITPFIPDCDVTITCAAEMQQYFLIIRPCFYRSFSQIVAAIQEAPPRPEPEIDASVTIYDPLSGDILKYPGRGINCRHCQCFDLKEYIKRATLCRRWVCPICSTLCELKDLVFSHQMKQYITDENQPPATSGTVSTPEEFQCDIGMSYDVDDFDF